MNTTNERPRVNVGVNIDYGCVEELFHVLTVERTLGHLRRERFPVLEGWTFGHLEELGLRVTRSEREYDGSTDVLCESDDGAALLQIDKERDGVLVVAAGAHGPADDLCARIVAGLRGHDPDPARVPARLWNCSNRPSFTRRSFDAPAWDELSSNYPSALREQLGRVLASSSEEVGGLALWFGPPGTGKTTAVRALARAWRTWCDVHVIVDPEALLTNPGYLMKVITERTWDDDLPPGSTGSEQRSRLVVLEDAGELIAADARATTGQGLSRVLNVSDGLVGRGLNTSILITTNEPIGHLHPAIRRPGRCWSQLHFGEFPAQEAASWLQARGLEPGTPSARTLAELYAIERGEHVPACRPLGFRA